MISCVLIVDGVNTEIPHQFPIIPRKDDVLNLTNTSIQYKVQYVEFFDGKDEALIHVHKIVEQ